jgi:glycosyl-4,4'-diaponeurosporenoate acyltransferase
MTALVWAANILGWPVVHLSIGSAALRLPPEHFTRDTWFTVPRRWEHDGRLYRKWLAIRKWKCLLPDGAPWLGGFAKKSFRARNSVDVAQFLLETRRAELAHWCMLGCLPVFFLWNPPWARWVMTGYAVAANLPCILVQRYNRFSLQRILRTRHDAFGPP